MVAYTITDCLPYFECSDSPCLNTGTVCEPSTVFCDLADSLEVILNSFDETVNRTATGVPFAKVALTSPQVETVTSGTFAFRINWDAVLADNDDMVNLDSDAQFVKITRPGIWWVELYVTGNPAESNDNHLNSYIIQRGPTVNSIPGTVLTQSTARFRTNMTIVQPAQVQNRAAFAFEVTAAQLALVGSVDIGAVASSTLVVPVGAELRIDSAQMNVYWTAEETP